MVYWEYEILDAEGLHARPASRVVMESMKFDSDIRITFGSQSADAKNILELLALGAGQKDRILIHAEGVDEKEALEAVIRVFVQNDGLNPNYGYK